MHVGVKRALDPLYASVSGSRRTRLCERDAVNRTRNAWTLLGTYAGRCAVLERPGLLLTLIQLPRAIARLFRQGCQIEHANPNEVLTHDSYATVGTITKWKVYLQTS